MKCTGLGIELEETFRKETIRLDVQSHQWYRIPIVEKGSCRAQDGKYFAYKNVATGYVLDYVFTWTGRGNVVATTDSLDRPNRHWRESRYDDVFVALENRANDQFLDHYDNKEMRVNGTSGNHPNRQWCTISQQPADNDIHEAIVAITNLGSGKVLAHDGKVQALDSRVGLATQQWRRLPIGLSKFFAFKNVASGMVLSAIGQQGIEASTCNVRSATHQWRECDVGGGRVAFQNRASGRILRCADTIHTIDKISCAEDQWLVRILPATQSSSTAEVAVVDKGVSTNSLFVAAKYGHLDRVRYLLDHGADASSLDNEGNCEKDLLPFVKLLLDRGTLPRKSNKQGISASYIAREKALYDILTILEEYGAKPVVRIKVSDQPEEEIPAWYISPNDIERDRIPFAYGGSGRVYKATWFNSRVVMKEIDIKSLEEMATFRKEVRLWRVLTHDNIVPFYGANHREPPYFTVSKLAVNGTLRQYLSINKNVTWRKLKEVAAGLSFLHQKDIVHGDLKGDNILVSENGVAMLTDFGLSFLDSSESCTLQRIKDQLGALQWRAPELTSANAKKPSFESDVYSLGMCIIEAMINATPAVNMEKPNELTADQWSLVTRMTAFDLHERPKLKEVLIALHVFVEKEAEDEAFSQSETISLQD